MIYQPAPVFEFRAAIAEGIVLAFLQAAEDFIAGTNKPWSYYLGIGIGDAAAATGIPGAAASIYVVCESVDVYLLHSDKGSLANVYLDGLQTAAIDTSLGPFGWVKHTIEVAAGVKHRIDLINGDPGANNTSGISWMGISQVQTNNGTAYERNLLDMATPSILSFQIADDNGDTKTLPIYFPLGSLTLAQISGVAALYAPVIDSVIDGKITGITVAVAIDLPSGLKGSAVSGSDKEKGALLTFDAAGTPYVSSLFVPTFKSSLFVGDNVNTSDSNVDALITDIKTGVTSGGGTLAASDKYGNDLTTLSKAVKRFRK